MESRGSDNSNRTVNELSRRHVHTDARNLKPESPLFSKKSTIWRRTRSTPPEKTDDALLNRQPRRKSVRELDQRFEESDPDRSRLSKKRSQFFENEFASRKPQSTARERVIKDSIITVEVKLNCNLEEAEQLFHCDLSFALSEVYQRPASCIMVLVYTGISILLQGTSEPAYYVTIIALSSEIAPTKNKRSVHFIQQFMHEYLGIEFKRGVVRFEAVPEQNLATNGFTTLQEIESLRTSSTDHEASQMLSSVRKPWRRDELNRVPPNDKQRTKLSHRGVNSLSATESPFERNSELSSTSAGKLFPRVKKRKSLMSFFGL